MTIRSLICVAVGFSAVLAPTLYSDVEGLPISRLYSLEEIGNLSPGANLGFDTIDRLEVVYEGAYFVLNDSTWLNMTERGRGEDMILSVYHSGGGRSYYGSRGSWGLISSTPEGTVHPESLSPKECPSWAATDRFTTIVPSDDSVYFVGSQGAVLWDESRHENSFFAVPELQLMFSVNENVYAWSGTQGMLRINAKAGSSVKLSIPQFQGIGLERAVELDRKHTLLATTDGRLLVFDGESLTPWAQNLNYLFATGISSFAKLAEGGLAVAINGIGVFILSEQGEILSSFTDLEYQSVKNLAAREKGVLWIASNKGIEKVSYGSSVTVIDHRLGIPIQWPEVARWRGKTIIASGGRLFEEEKQTATNTTSFEVMPGTPAGGAWAMGAGGDQLLAANHTGVFARDEAENFPLVGAGIDVTRLVMVNSEFCYAIGTNEIAAFSRGQGGWAECAPRIIGLGFPWVVHAAGTSAWVELGTNRVARIDMRDGKLESRVFDTFPWSEPQWVDIGVVGNIVVLSGVARGRIFFDEKTAAFCDPFDLKSILDLSPQWINRMEQDGAGTIWASYNSGVIQVIKEPGGYRLGPTVLDLSRDRSPIVRIVENDDVWFSTGTVLYHVQSRSVAPENLPVQPVLASIADARTGQYLVGPTKRETHPTFRYASNSLNFRFFAGTYSVRNPTYRFKLKDHSGEGPIHGAESPFTLLNLKEGSYSLEVTASDGRGPLGPPLSLTFAISPPWFRSPYAYIFGVVGSVLGFYLVTFWTSGRMKSKNLVLEKLVQKRTEELNSAMQQLNEETRNAATLAERQRLAAEIHDGLQQGLTGLMLQLDATLKLPQLTSDVRSRLAVARRMVSFTRREVEHAVWDLESPLLDNVDLGDALREMVSSISTGEVQVEVRTSGQVRDIPSTIKHQLLRVGQEAITNAVRHSGAKRIDVSLSYELECVRITVTDCGQGFVPDLVLQRQAGHFGLRGLRVRARKMNGHLAIQSSPGNGTTLTIEVPTMNLKPSIDNEPKS